jgi:hypothetical protein
MSGSKSVGFCSGLDKESVLLGYDAASMDMWFPMCPEGSGLRAHLTLEDETTTLS